jgi:zinc D-Ala-D-Ala dipeptidase
MPMRAIVVLLVSISWSSAFGDAVKIVPKSREKEPLVELAKVAPRVVIDLRYTTPRNLAKRPIYPKNARCFIRQSVAERLKKAQEWLDSKTTNGTRLKIWDGWRPKWAQVQLWKVLPDREYLGDPNRGGSLHTWGVCVDATLCDSEGRDLQMPTDFDEISPAAKTIYEGGDAKTWRNLRLLQGAMTHAGFVVVLDEWWHFVARDWKAFGPMDVSITGDEVPE